MSFSFWMHSGDSRSFCRQESGTEKSQESFENQLSRESLCIWRHEKSWFEIACMIIPCKIVEVDVWSTILY